MTAQQIATEPGLSAWTRFLRAHAAVTRQLSGRLEAEHGLTLSDFDVLIQLYHAPDRQMRRVDLSRSVLLTASGITRLLDGLERAGWVTKGRCNSDARVTYAVLTDDGVAKCEAARKTHLADVEELFGAPFTPEERDQLAALLGRLPLAHTSEACSA
ncbi:MAG TPA: MarR family transcriptional regulator [Gaiellaceae bacterium]|nr:MarR family transcriptional regulator [Gaiellaceae bacterium]